MQLVRSCQRVASLHPRCTFRTISTTPIRKYTHQTSSELNIEQLLATPTWSVSSLLPSSAPATDESGPHHITSKQLHHLLRLSALPPPTDAAEEQRMLSTLSAQLHFVRDVQSVDTTGVEPLKSLRDETRQGEKEAELGLKALEEALGKEEIRGKWHRRVRRKRDAQGMSGGEEPFDVLGTASRRVGRYFVVEGGKEDG